MNLDTIDKENLKLLKNHPWYKVLQKIEEEEDRILWKRLATFNMDDEKDLKTIKWYQLYKKARDDFFMNTERYTRELYKPKF